MTKQPAEMAQDEALLENYELLSFLKAVVGIGQNGDDSVSLCLDNNAIRGLGCILDRCFTLNSHALGLATDARLDAERRVDS